MTEQRYKAVQGVLADGRTVSEVASQWEVSPRTLHRWLARYEGARWLDVRHWGSTGLQLGGS